MDNALTWRALFPRTTVLHCSIRSARSSGHRTHPTDLILPHSDSTRSNSRTRATRARMLRRRTHCRAIRGRFGHLSGAIRDWTIKPRVFHHVFGLLQTARPDLIVAGPKQKPNGTLARRLAGELHAGPLPHAPHLHLAAARGCVVTVAMVGVCHWVTAWRASPFWKFGRCWAHLLPYCPNRYVRTWHRTHHGIFHCTETRHCTKKPGFYQSCLRTSNIGS